MLAKFMVPGLVLVLLHLSSCGRGEAPRSVDLQKREAVAPREPAAGKARLRFAVGGMITPKEGLAYYKDFLNYVADKLGQDVELVDRDDYAEINDLLRGRNLDAAFVCSGPYVDGHRDFGLELLVAPQAYGMTVYHSYIIVPKGSPASRLEDLRGKRFAFTDPLSNTGKLVPTYMLARMNETPDTFFAKYVFTKGHDQSIKAVAQGVVDGASVDSLIWEYVDRTNPRYTSKTKIIVKSDPYGIPPVVVPKDLDPALKEKLKGILLSAHEDGKGKALLRQMMIDRFVVVEDGAYDSIREMQSWVAGAKAGSPKPR